MSDKNQGLYKKYMVVRTDGSSAPGGKHEDCYYFVLDVTHDPFAGPALAAYAKACKAEYPQLAADLHNLVNGPHAEEVTPPAAGTDAGVGEWTDYSALVTADLIAKFMQNTPDWDYTPAAALTFLYGLTPPYLSYSDPSGFAAALSEAAQRTYGYYGLLFDDSNERKQKLLEAATLYHRGLLAALEQAAGNPPRIDSPGKVCPDCDTPLGNAQRCPNEDLPGGAAKAADPVKDTGAPDPCHNCFCQDGPVEVAGEMQCSQKAAEPPEPATPPRKKLKRTPEAPEDKPAPRSAPIEDYPTVAELTAETRKAKTKAKQATLIFIINGENWDERGDVTEPLKALRNRALKASQNVGRPPDEWQIRNEEGQLLDPNRGSRGPGGWRPPVRVAGRRLRRVTAMPDETPKWMRAFGGTMGHAIVAAPDPGSVGRALYTAACGASILRRWAAPWAEPWARCRECTRVLNPPAPKPAPARFVFDRKTHQVVSTRKGA